MKKDEELDVKEKELQAKDRELEDKVKELQAKDEQLAALEAKIKKKNRCLEIFLCVCVVTMLVAMLGNVKMA